MSDWLNGFSHILPRHSFPASNGMGKKQASRFSALLTVAETFAASKIKYIFQCVKQLFGRNHDRPHIQIVIVKPSVNAEDEDPVQDVAGEVFSPAPETADEVDPAEEGAWKVSQKSTTEVTGTPSTPTLFQSALDKMPKNPLLLIPPFLFSLYKSEERIVQNINVHLSALDVRKVYQIGFGKKNGDELSIAFEVQAGIPIRFLHDITSTQAVNDQIPVIFAFKSLLSQLPLLHHFVWKREKRETDCNIFIDDPSNPLLKEGPVKAYISLSSQEGFHVIQRDSGKANNDEYHRKENGRGIERIANIFNYAGMNSAKVTIKHMDSAIKSRTEFFPLPFYDDPKKAQEFYLKVTQIQ